MKAVLVSVFLASFGFGLGMNFAQAAPIDEIRQILKNTRSAASAAEVAATIVKRLAGEADRGAAVLLTLRGEDAAFSNPIRANLLARALVLNEVLRKDPAEVFATLRRIIQTHDPDDLVETPYMRAHALLEFLSRRHEAMPNEPSLFSKEFHALQESERQELYRRLSLLGPGVVAKEFGPSFNLAQVVADLAIELGDQKILHRAVFAPPTDPRDRGNSILAETYVLAVSKLQKPEHKLLKLITSWATDALHEVAGGERMRNGTLQFARHIALNIFVAKLARGKAVDFEFFYALRSTDKLRLMLLMLNEIPEREHTKELLAEHRDLREAAEIQRAILRLYSLTQSPEERTCLNGILTTMYRGSLQTEFTVGNLLRRRHVIETLVSLSANPSALPIITESTQLHELPNTCEITAAAGTPQNSGPQPERPG